MVLCCLLLATPVLAASAVSDLQSVTTISSTGECQVALTITMRVEEAASSAFFPLPASAIDISLNGSAASTVTTSQSRQVDLSGVLTGTGTYTFRILYTLPDAVTAGKDGTLTLSLELLSGFAYPVESMEFSIQLPGEITETPSFSSTYYPEQTMEEQMDYTVSGAVISGTFTETLKDHDTVVMTLAVSENMFPQSPTKTWSVDAYDIAMVGCAALAAVYWLLCLRCPPPKRLRRTKAPEGMNAGEVGCCLTGQGVDFTMMVLSWAQMGYLLIQLDDNGRVLLHKRMDMGNERSAFEVRCFRSLFGKKRMVDGTGYHYARLARKAAGSFPNGRYYYLPTSGNPYLFRALAAVVGILSGISLASAMAVDTVWRVIASILLGILGGAVSWQLQSAGKCLHLRSKWPLWSASVWGIVWLVLGILAGKGALALLVIGFQLLAGLACAYGGRRSEAGKQLRGELLGLRHYLKSIPSDTAKHLLRQNPDYFYQMAPFAAAMGVDQAFARQFGNRRLPGCTYLATGMDEHLTAREWDRLLREAITALDERKKHLALDQLLGK